MTRYLIRRGAGSLVTLFLFATAMFFLVQIIVPADFTVQFAMGMTREERIALGDELGLNLPLWQQYLNWLRDFFTGKLGTSFYGNSVIDVLRDTLPLSMLVFIPGAVLAYLIGLQLGKFTGWKSPPLASNVTTLGGLALFNSFPPWLAWLVAYLIGRRAGILRGFFGSTLSSFDRMLWIETDFTPDTVASRMLGTLAAGALLVWFVHWLLKRRFNRGIPIGIAVLLALSLSAVSWSFLGIQPLAADVAGAAFVPLITFTMLSFGETMLIMRTSMTDHRQAEYINVARAKGLPEHVVRDRHASRNAILPVVSRMVITFPYLLTGVVIIEDVLDWHGVGTTLFSSLYQQDMPMVMALFMMVGAITLIARLFLEVLLAMLDPRLRIAAAEPETL